MGRRSVRICWPQRVASGTLSGGSYASGMPLSGLEAGRLGVLARTTNANLTSTRFSCALGSSRRIRVVSFSGSNLSDAAQIKVTFGTSAFNDSLYDSGWVTAWPMLATHTAMAAYGVEPATFDRTAYEIGVVIPNSAVTTAHVNVYIDDTSNADGYVEFSAPFIGGAWTSTYGVSSGMVESLSDRSEVPQAEDGSDWPIERHVTLGSTFVLHALTDAEADLLQVMRRGAGVTKDIFYIASESDRAAQQLYGFRARFEELASFEYPHPRMNDLPIRLVQRV